MNARELLSTTLLAGLAFTAIPFTSSRADEPDALEMVQNFTPPGHEGTCGVTSSHDGKFLYSAGWQASVRIFKRDSLSGQLTPVDSPDAADTSAAICIRISADDKYATVARAGTCKATVLSRDPETGKLVKVADASVQAERRIDGRSHGVMDACLSRDDQFLYTASGDGLGVYHFAQETLDLVQFEEADGQLEGGRCLAFSPDEHWLYAVASLSGTLSVFRRDAASGKLEAFQILKCDVDDLPALQGAFHLALSPNGQQVYVCAGRFNSQSAISVFSVRADGTLALLQQLDNDTDDLTEFDGGNGAAVSPDGKFVLATASVSDRLLRFARNQETGKLTFVASQQANTFRAPGAASVCFSPDGKFVYVADEAENAIQAYKIP